MKGVPFSNKRYTKGVHVFSEKKIVYKRVRVGPGGGASPYKTFLGTPRAPNLCFGAIRAGGFRVEECKSELHYKSWLVCLICRSLG